jgi:hypothetical protein
VSESLTFGPFTTALITLYSDAQVSGRTHGFGHFFGCPTPVDTVRLQPGKRPTLLDCPALQPSTKKSRGALPLLKSGPSHGRRLAGIGFYPSQKPISGLPGRHPGEEVRPPNTVVGECGFSHQPKEGWADVKSPGAEHVGNLERFGLRVDNIDRRRNPLFSRDRQRGGAGRLCPQIK